MAVSWWTTIMTFTTLQLTLPSTAMHVVHPLNGIVVALNLSAI